MIIKRYWSIQYKDDIKKILEKFEKDIIQVINEREPNKLGSKLIRIETIVRKS